MTDVLGGNNNVPCGKKHLVIRPVTIARRDIRVLDLMMVIEIGGCNVQVAGCRLK